MQITSNRSLTNFFLLSVICLFIYLSTLIAYYSQYPIYSFSLYPFSSSHLNINIGIFVLIIFNLIILEYSKKVDDLWINPETMDIPILLVTLYFAGDSISHFVKSLNNHFSAGDPFVNIFGNLGTVFDYTDIFAFSVIILSVLILLYRYSLFYGIFLSLMFRYLILFFIAMIISYVVLQGSFLKIDEETAKYTISTIVQSEAAILALFFSLSLIIMQQAASSYPPEVSKLFRDFKTNPIFFITTVIYLVSIILGVCVLIQIKTDDPNWENYQKYIMVVFLVSIFAFLSMSLFVYNTFKFLIPKNLIKILSNNEISGTSSIDEKNCIHILGILLNSLKKYDYSTVKEGLDDLENYKIELLEPQKNIVLPRESERYLKLERSLFCLTNYFSNVGTLSIEVGFSDCATKIIKNLYDIREVAYEQGMDGVISVTTKSIGELGKEVVYLLIAELNDKNPEIRKCASFTLGEIRDDRALSQIIQLFENEGKCTQNGNDIQYTIISSLGKMKSENANMFLLEVVKKGNPNVINEIFSTFCENELLSRESLTIALNDDDPYLRSFAALGFGAIGDERDIEVLSNLLLDEDSYVRGKAAHAIGNINDRYPLYRYDLKKLVERIDDPNPYVRFNAVYSLSKIGIEDTRVISKIEQLLYDLDPYVRDSTVYALKKGNDHCFFESLLHALNTETEQSVRFNIIIALGNIIGFDKIGPLLQGLYFPQMSLSSYKLVCNSHLGCQEQSSMLPLYVAAFCTKSKCHGNNSLSKVFHDL